MSMSTFTCTICDSETRLPFRCDFCGYVVCARCVRIAPDDGLGPIRLCKLCHGAEGVMDELPVRGAIMGMMMQEECYPAMTIAPGTQFQFRVIDLSRCEYPWTDRVEKRWFDASHRMIIHHSSHPCIETTIAGEVVHLVKLSLESPFGLPYHFVIATFGRVYYLHDFRAMQVGPDGIHRAGDIAVCCCGDFDVEAPTENMLASIRGLADALSFESGKRIEVLCHSEIKGSTYSCPGGRMTHAIQKMRNDGLL